MSVLQNHQPETPLQKAYWGFWKGFNDYTRLDVAFSRQFKVHPYPAIRSYQDYSIGYPFHIVAGINFQRFEIRVGVYFGNLVAYDSCHDWQRDWIESRLNRHLTWTRHHTKGSAYAFYSANFNKNGNWVNAYRVMITNMLKMKEAFTADVKL
jgi:hypothetical protein